MSEDSGIMRGYVLSGNFIDQRVMAISYSPHWGKSPAPDFVHQKRKKGGWRMCRSVFPPPHGLDILCIIAHEIGNEHGER
jgi:hypothetical protein